MDLPCEQWPGSLNSNGYGTVTLPGGRSTSAQRWAWESHYGLVPDGYEVHHVCKNRACIEPTHLVILTRAEHIEVHAVTHCAQGHEFTEENTRWNNRSSGKRQRVCRICAAAASRAWRLKRG